MADWLEGFVPMKMHVLIRFGRWDDIIAAPLPADQDLYCVTTAMTHYAKGVACAATGRIAEARRAARRCSPRPSAGSRRRAPCSTTPARTSSPWPRRCWTARWTTAKGSYDVAFGHLRRAVELDDGLPYDEPWGWMQPARHAYGALLLEQGRVAEAEPVYRADLGLDATLARACQHPGNVWSLHGYHECLIRLGKDEQAGIVGQQLKSRPPTRSRRSRHLATAASVHKDAYDWRGGPWSAHASRMGQ